MPNDITFRAASSNTDLTGSATSLALAAPTGLADGDGQYIWAGSFTVGGGFPVHTPPSGWVADGTATFSFGTTQGRLSCFSRVASSDGSASFTTDIGAFQVGARCAYQFPHPATWPSGITLAGGATASSTSHVAGGITTTRRRQLTTWLFVGSAGCTWTSPGSVTERVDVGSGVSFMVADAIEDAIGATGSRTFTSSATVEGYWMVAAFNPQNVTQVYMAQRLRGR